MGDRVLGARIARPQTQSTSNSCRTANGRPYIGFLFHSYLVSVYKVSTPVLLYVSQPNCFGFFSIYYIL